MWIYEALLGVETRDRTVSAVDISGVQYDSRKVRPGDLFVAMRGGATDGNRFIPQAIERGAKAIVTDSPVAFANRPKGTPFYLVEHGRRALATIAANLLDHPERKLKVSAVTGTNGKTTTAFLLEQMLKSVGRKCILIGTIETRIGDEVRPSEHTTPEASDLLQLFADGVEAGCTEVVMEMSSHALDQERVFGIHVDTAIFTNLTQDHLDYHGTMEKYFEAKAKLFAGIGAAPPRISVVNDDDPWGERLSYAARGQVLRYALAKPYLPPNQESRGAPSIAASSRWGGSQPPEPGGPEYQASDMHVEAGKTTYLWHTPQGEIEIASPLTGRVNVYNLLAASCAALARGLTLEQIQSAAANLKQVPGRFETVPNPLGLTVVVDYAHTDDALRNLITLARDLVAPRSGRVITLFGCGGDRDRTKRPKMGRAAGELSDLVLLTSDNPRTEDPETILNEALAGVRETKTPCEVEPDRATAIAKAIHAAKPGDIVLIAGKGHEKVQILADRTLPCDDVAEAQKVLTSLSWLPHPNP
jgi:UDP-N-acetylmuramoyl-L-alanyl-D-glutamate--2,6-diaminopimelate ligase